MQSKTTLSVGAKALKEGMQLRGGALVWESRDMVVIHESRLPALLPGRLTALEGRCRNPMRELAALCGLVFSTALLVCKADRGLWGYCVAASGPFLPPGAESGLLDPADLGLRDPPERGRRPADAGRDGAKKQES